MKKFPSKSFQLADVAPMTPAEWRRALFEELLEKIALYPDEALAYVQRFVMDLRL